VTRLATLLQKILKAVYADGIIDNIKTLKYGENKRAVNPGN
jgi:hypothetical protein